ncbi:MAG: hypothetical protein ACTSQE_13115 [Candidatus Heimdallarchaeaceae archaeon]
MNETNEFTIVTDNAMESGVIKLNKQDLDNLGIKEGTMVEIIDTMTEGRVPAKTQRDTEITEGHVKVNSNFIASIGLSEGFSCEISVLGDEEFMVANEIFITLEKTPGSTEDVDLSKLAGDIENIKDFLDDRIIANNTSIDWKEKNVILEIEHIEADDKTKTSYKFKKDKTAINIGTKGRPFHGILLLDISDSMKTRDVEIQGIETAISALESNMEGIEHVDLFFNDIKRSRKIMRLDAAVLAILQYLYEKIGRGYGEKTGIISFAESPNINTFSASGTTKNWFDLGDFVSTREKTPSILGSLILNIRENAMNTKTKSTDIYTTMEQAIDLAEEMSKDDSDKSIPVMIVLLTDGIWTKGPNGGNPTRPILNKNIDKRLDRVIHVVGIGKDIEKHEAIYKSLVKYSHGEFQKFDNAKELLKWYSSLATKFSLSI